MDAPGYRKSDPSQTGYHGIEHRHVVSPFAPDDPPWLPRYPDNDDVHPTFDWHGHARDTQMSNKRADGNNVYRCGRLSRILDN